MTAPTPTWQTHVVCGSSGIKLKICLRQEVVETPVLLAEQLCPPLTMSRLLPGQGVDVRVVSGSQHPAIEQSWPHIKRL